MLTLVAIYLSLSKAIISLRYAYTAFQYTCIANEPYPKLRHKNKMAAVVWPGDVRKICIGDYGEKNFLNGDISAKMEDIKL